MYFYVLFIILLQTCEFFCFAVADNRTLVRLKHICYRIKIYPYFVIALFLAFVKHKLKPQMQVGSFDSVGVFGCAVAGSADVADNISRFYFVPLVQALSKRSVLSKMGIVPVPLCIIRTDADSPAAVLILAHTLNLSRFDRNNRSSDCRHNIVTEVRTLVAVGPLRSEIIIA